MNDWLIDLFIDWMIVWLNEWLIDWIIDWLIAGAGWSVPPPLPLRLTTELTRDLAPQAGGIHSKIDKYKKL